MRMLLVLLMPILAGCQSNDLCHAIPVGARVEGFTHSDFTSSQGSDPVYSGFLSSSAGTGLIPKLKWDVGPTDEAMCCGMQQLGRTLSWCTPEQLKCTDPKLQRVQLSLLSAPYSDFSREPDDAEACFVATHDGEIIAIWHRYWS